VGGTSKNSVILYKTTIDIRFSIDTTGNKRPQHRHKRGSNKRQVCLQEKELFVDWIQRLLHHFSLERSFSRGDLAMGGGGSIYILMDHSNHK
tara:strand:+ start:2422 stop:2697 length:276 start_codon:yes stop_codon:yes gene_type:complete